MTDKEILKIWRDTPPNANTDAELVAFARALLSVSKPAATEDEIAALRKDSDYLSAMATLLAKARSETAALSRAVTDTARVYETVASVNGPYVSRELRDLLAASTAVPAQSGERKSPFALTARESLETAVAHALKGVPVEECECHGCERLREQGAPLGKH
jgi:molybdopterin-guanine dinucleotide biosynthesis protein A